MFNKMLDTIDDPLTQELIKQFHYKLKSGVFEDRANGYAIGNYKKRPNMIGMYHTTRPENVADEMNVLINWYFKQEVNVAVLAEFHARYESIHPFQDGNGRTGRLIIFRECLKNEIVPMYVDILGASMHMDTANFIHPSFVIVIKQLTPDEAKIIKKLPRKGLHEPLVNVCVQKPNLSGTFVVYRNCGVLGEEAECLFPEKLSLYIDNLQRLALVEVPEHICLADKWRYDKVIKSEYINSLLKQSEKEGKSFYEEK